jgi:hypothetical protein
MKKDYIDQVLVPVVAEISEVTLEHYGYSLLYQDDRNCIHGFTGIQDIAELKDELSIQAINEWPASSPDFNPIEQVWRSLKQRLSQCGPWLQISDLRATLLKKYNKLLQAEL